MIAGVVLQDTRGETCQLAFLGDSLECVEATSNEDIISEIESRKPELVAVNAAKEEGEGLTDQESELKEEGHSFMPSSHRKELSKRFEALEKMMEVSMGAEKPAIVRFDPRITSKELALDGDDALEALGIDTSPIESAKMFDAVLGAVTARFYQQNQYKDLGVIVPEALGGDAEDF